jgi:hypothetical protein
MKQRVLSKTSPFHVKKNSVILSDIVPPFSSPRRATGEDKFFVFSSLFLPASDEKPGGHAMQATPIGHLAPHRDRAGRPHSPCATIGQG